MVKICSCCKIEKSTSEFYKQKNCLYGVRSDCKSCSKERSTKHYIENREDKIAYAKKYNEEYRKTEKSKNYRKWYRDNTKEEQKRYRLENAEKLKEYRDSRKEITKIRNKKYKEEYKEKENLRLKSDPVYKLKKLIRRRILHILKAKNLKKNKRTIDYLGCSASDLMIHLESQFKDGMTWENHGKWHIDHIIPLASAKNEEDIFRLNHYTNLQPLWAEDNFKKGSRK